MNRTIAPKRPLCLLAVVFLWVPFAGALTPVEQADDFFTRGSAEEQRGDAEAARSCYELALRALPGHRGALDKLAALAKRKADDLVALGSAAETKGDLKTANLQYVLALDASPGHLDAARKVAELKKKMGDSFKDGGEIIIEDKLGKIVVPRIDFVDTSLEEAVDFLRLRSAELDVATSDPAKKGINFVIREAQAGGNPGVLRIRELRVRNVPLAVALKYICDQTKTRYLIEDTGVTFVMANELTGLLVNPSQGAPRLADSVPAARPSTPPASPSAPLVWKSKDGRSVPGEYVGLDGEAVVIKRDGKEFTIPFTRLDPDSISQARDLARTAAGK